MLASVINDPQVKVVAEERTLFMPASAPSKLGTEMFAALEHAQKEVAPEAITLPVMSTGATEFFLENQRSAGIRDRRPKDGRRKPRRSWQ